MDNCVSVCACNSSLSNTGMGCIPIWMVTRKVIFVPLLDSTGALNYINLATTLNQAYFTAKFNNTDTLARFYPSPTLETVTNNREDHVTEEFGDGSQAHVRDGIRKFSAFIRDQGASPKMVGALKKTRCNKMGVFLVDLSGNIIGKPSADLTKLYPIRIDSGSFDAMLEMPTNTTVTKLPIKFNFHQDEKDECLGTISISDMASDVTPLDWEGLVDVRFEAYGALTSTTLTVKVIATGQGTPMNPVTVKGLTTANFMSYYTSVTSKMRNKTTPADVTIAAVETPALSGIYILTFAAQTATNKLALAIRKDGYESPGSDSTEFTAV